MVECMCENVDTWMIHETDSGRIEVCVVCYMLTVLEDSLSNASTPRNHTNTPTE